MAEPTTPPTPTPPAPPAPELIVGKFKDQAAFETGIREIAKKLEYPMLDDQPIIGQGAMFKDIEHAKMGYTAFEKMMARRTPATTPEPKQGETPPPTSKPVNDPLTIAPVNVDETVDAVLTKAGLAATDLATSWATDGKLTDAQYAALAKQGYPKAMVDGYMAGQAAAAGQAASQKQQIVNDAATIVGGQEALTNLFGWAAMNIPKDEIGDPAKPAPGTLNHRLNDPKLYKGAIAELQQRHSAAIKSGGAKPLINGGGGAGSGAGGLITDPAELKKVTQAVERGDEQAKARLLAHSRARRGIR